MMKRVGFRGFKQFYVGRKMPPCLRLGGGHGANGDPEFCRESNCDPELACPCEDPRSENCDCHRTKNNILSAIRRKWRRQKRNKRGDARKKNDFQNQDVEPLRPKTQKNDRSSADNLEDTMYASGTCRSDEKTSCHNRADRATKETKLTSHSSKSMSDISSVSKTHISSLVCKTDSENDVAKHTSAVNSRSEKDLLFEEEFEIQEEKHLFVQDMDNAIAKGQKFGNLIQELHKLSKFGWYWGPINRREAEEKLVDQPDGAFLVRDSSDDRYILSLSFRSYGKTFHTRIEYSNGLFSFYSQPEPEGHASIVQLILLSMCYSQTGVFCYSRSRSPGSPSLPVRLMKPISRFTQVRSLQYLCRFVIRQYTRYDHIQKLPLPPRIKGYLEEGHY